MIEPTEDLDRAAGALANGGLAVVPTETVHGLAADATNGGAVARIFEAKGRPRFNPLIAHVDGAASAARLVSMDGRAERLAGRFWPGPLTLVLPLREGAGVHPLVTAGLDTLAVRVPRGPMAELSRRLGRPLAAPSANVSGRVSATRTAHVMGDLAPRLDEARDVVLPDAMMGDAPVGLESTIVSLVGEHAELLRAGGLPRAEIEDALGGGLASAGEGGARPRAPGMLASHYAPRGTVRLDARHVAPHEFLIAFGPERAAGAPSGVYQLSAAGNLAEAARRLFDALHAANAAGAGAIAVEPIPRDGLGEAIADRLARAAAPRSDG